MNGPGSTVKRNSNVDRSLTNLLLNNEINASNVSNASDKMEPQFF